MNIKDLLRRAVDEGDCEGLRTLLLAAPRYVRDLPLHLTVSPQPSCSQMLLVRAVDKCKPEIIRVLGEVGVSPNAFMDCSRNVHPLLNALRAHNFQCAGALVEIGADINCPGISQKGWGVPMIKYFATRWPYADESQLARNAQVVEFLLERGAKLDASHYSPRTSNEPETPGEALIRLTLEAGGYQERPDPPAAQFEMDRDRSMAALVTMLRAHVIPRSAQVIVPKARLEITLCKDEFRLMTWDVSYPLDDPRFHVLSYDDSTLEYPSWGLCHGYYTIEIHQFPTSTTTGGCRHEAVSDFLISDHLRWLLFRMLHPSPEDDRIHAGRFQAAGLSDPFDGVPRYSTCHTLKHTFNFGDNVVAVARRRPEELIDSVEPPAGPCVRIMWSPRLNLPSFIGREDIHY